MHFNDIAVRVLREHLAMVELEFHNDFSIGSVEW